MEPRGQSNYLIPCKEHRHTMRFPEKRDEWRAKNRFWVNKRRAREAKITEVYSKEEWDQKVKETNGICSGCNTFVGTTKLTLDHIIPISLAKPGTIYTIDDVQPLCLSCNSRKYNGKRTCSLP